MSWFGRIFTGCLGVLLWGVLFVVAIVMIVTGLFIIF